MNNNNCKMNADASTEFPPPPPSPPADVLAPKPRRSMSSYNLYFQVIRRRILASRSDPSRDFDSRGLDRPISPEELSQVLKSNVNKPKRKHRKTHGAISFKILTLTIAALWKEVDLETKRMLDVCAAREKSRYKEDMKVWKQAEATFNARAAASMTKASSISLCCAPEEKIGPGMMPTPCPALPRQVSAVSSSSSSSSQYCRGAVQESQSELDNELAHNTTIVCHVLKRDIANGIDLFQPMEEQDMDLLFDDY
eukprot:CAMPEP_0172444654 /NCGR_PEP_ID=MMETSP1065-20121228/4678_1 /TAXON_ID=265537 /ORGANISM="Amphiprora paludosa, Strain CCMP125" /LENGTH=252 /DNA_ID=CAMNT_0013195277 /DNA_START=158 /DNA_END=916 /DNA_ORIENTATION=+